MDTGLLSARLNEGYVTLPSGLTIQWGYDPREKADDAGHWMPVIFPKAFALRCFYFHANSSHTNQNGVYIGYMHLEHTAPIGLQSAEYRKRYCDQAFWIAIGF